MLDRPLSDEIQEVDESSATSEENTSVIEASTSSSEDPAAKTPTKKICCPICWDDEQTVSTLILTFSVLPYTLYNIQLCVYEVVNLAL